MSFSAATTPPRRASQSRAATASPLDPAQRFASALVSSCVPRGGTTGALASSWALSAAATASRFFRYRRRADAWSSPLTISVAPSAAASAAFVSASVSSRTRCRSANDARDSRWSANGLSAELLSRRNARAFFKSRNRYARHCVARVDSRSSCDSGRP